MDFSEETLWKKVKDIQNSLNESDCLSYMNKLVNLYGNAVTPTANERMELLKSMGKH